MKETPCPTENQEEAGQVSQALSEDPTLKKHFVYAFFLFILFSYNHVQLIMLTIENIVSQKPHEDPQEGRKGDSRGRCYPAEAHSG